MLGALMGRRPGMLVLVLGLLASFNLILARVDLSCSIIVYNSRDYTKDDKPQSFCMDGVDRAKSRCGGQTINFVPYAKYTFKLANADNGPDAPVPDKLVYDINGQSVSPGQLEIDNFYQALSECMTHAVSVGFTTVAITPHLDAWDYDLWRNLLMLEPYTSYGGVTYQTAFIDPLIKAARDALAKGATQVRFALEGEMNRALVSFPASWMKLREYVATELRKDASWPPSAVLVGVSMNWNKLCGELCDKEVRKPGAAALKDQFAQLVKTSDFLGVSSYPSQWPTWSKNETMDFGSSLRNIDTELQAYVGFSLLDLTDQGVQLQLSEFGIGGGKDSNARDAAPSLRVLASRIYAIVGGPYGQHQDPWKRNWARKFRYRFIVRALWWLNENSKDGTQTRNAAVAATSLSGSAVEGSPSPPQADNTTSPSVPAEAALGTTVANKAPEATPSPPAEPAASQTPISPPLPSPPAKDDKTTGFSVNDTTPAIPAPGATALDQALRVIQDLHNATFGPIVNQSAVVGGRKMLGRRRRKKDKDDDDDNDDDDGKEDNDNDSTDDENSSGDEVQDANYEKSSNSQDGGQGSAAEGARNETTGNATQPELSRSDKKAVEAQSHLGRYPISAAFLWSMGSMDLAAVYHLSTTEKGSYYAKDVCDIIYTYNEKGELPEWN